MSLAGPSYHIPTLWPRFKSLSSETLVLPASLAITQAATLMMSASVAYKAYKEFKLLSQDFNWAPEAQAPPRPLVPPPSVKESGLLKSPPTPAPGLAPPPLNNSWYSCQSNPSVITSNPQIPLSVLIIWSCPLPGFNPKFLFPLLV